MAGIQKLLGGADTKLLHNDDSKTATVKEIVGDGDGWTVGLYFSAHWCPPCRGFTPKLIEFYNNYKKDGPSKDKMDLVFISSDKDADQFKDYFSTMPWYALPYELRDLKVSNVYFCIYTCMCNHKCPFDTFRSYDMISFSENA